MAPKIIGRQVESTDVQEAGTIAEFRNEGQAWNFRLDHTPHGLGFEQPLASWFHLQGDMLQEVQQAFSIGDKVKVAYSPDLTVRRIEAIEN